MRLKGGVFADGEVAAAVVPLLDEMERRIRRDGRRLHPVAAAFFEELRVEARRWRDAGAPVESSSAGRNTSEYRRTAVEGGSVMVGGVSLSAAEVAQRWECTTRNVTAMAGRGALPGRKVAGGGWRFQLVDVEAVEAGREDR